MTGSGNVATANDGNQVGATPNVQVDSQLLAMLRQWELGNAAYAHARNGFTTLNRFWKMRPEHVKRLNLPLAVEMGSLLVTRYGKPSGTSSV